MGPTPKDGYPVDLGYNVEESLPNLAFYAAAAGNDALAELVGCSMRSHLEFMLPDGAWDNSWGTRSFKWTYWGSRTSDGMAAGYALFMDEYPEFRTAVRRNLELLRRATYGGMLYGGMHYRSAGQPPCNHHTFSHARGLASLLAVYEPASADAMPLPREAAEGVREFRDIRTWLVAAGSWRATITDLDAPYRVMGTHPMGGALSLLWHRTLGPVFAAGMNRYALIEPTNMQMGSSGGYGLSFPADRIYPRRNPLYEYRRSFCKGGVSGGMLRISWGVGRCRWQRSAAGPGSGRYGVPLHGRGACYAGQAAVICCWSGACRTAVYRSER